MDDSPLSTRLRYESQVMEALVPLAGARAPLAACVPAKAPVMGSKPRGEGVGADREMVREVRKARNVEGRRSMVGGW